MSPYFSVFALVKEWGLKIPYSQIVCVHLDKGNGGTSNIWQSWLHTSRGYSCPNVTSVWEPTACHSCGHRLYCWSQHMQVKYCVCHRLHDKWLERKWQYIEVRGCLLNNTVMKGEQLFVFCFCDNQNYLKEHKFYIMMFLQRLQTFSYTLGERSTVNDSSNHIFPSCYHYNVRFAALHVKSFVWGSAKNM